MLVDPRYPDNWALASFQEVAASFQNGCGVRRSEGGISTVVLRLADVSLSGELAEGDALRLVGLSDQERDRYALRPGDLLVFRVNGSRDITGQVVMYEGPEGFAYCDHFIRVRLTGGIDPRFIALQCSQGDTRRAVETGMVTTAGQNTISQGTLATVPLRVAPVPEQKRIVAKVEELTARSRRAKEALDAVPPLLDQLRQSILAAGCSGRLTSEGLKNKAVPSAWRWSRLDDLVVPGGIFDGARDHGLGTAAEQNLRVSDYTTSGIRVVRLENLAPLTFVDGKHTYISEKKYAGLKQATVLEGDILFGSFIENRIRVCLLPPLETAAIAKADCFVVRVRPEMILPEYLMLQLACERTRVTLGQQIHGATRPRITTRQLRSIQVPVCSIDEQRAIVDNVASLLSVAGKIEGRVAAAAVELEKLVQAILAKAFRGELVPQDPDDEPASLLLERIQAAPDSAEPAGSRARRYSHKAEGVTEGSKYDGKKDAATPIRPQSAGAA